MTDEIELPVTIDSVEYPREQVESWIRNYLKDQDVLTVDDVNTADLIAHIHTRARNLAYDRLHTEEGHHDLVEFRVTVGEPEGVEDILQDIIDDG